MSKVKPGRQAWYSVRIGKKRPDGRGQTQYFLEFLEEAEDE